MSVYPPLHQASCTEESNVKQALLPIIATQHMCTEKSSAIDQGPYPSQ